MKEAELFAVAIFGALICGALYLMIHRWFWIIAFLLAGLAAFFTALACIIHFQIAVAVGAFVLGFLLWVVAAMIADAHFNN